MFYFPNLRKPFSLELSMTYTNFVMHTFVNKIESFTFPTNLNPSGFRDLVNIDSPQLVMELWPHKPIVS